MIKRKFHSPILLKHYCYLINCHQGNLALSVHSVKYLCLRILRCVWNTCSLVPILILRGGSSIISIIERRSSRAWETGPESCSLWWSWDSNPGFLMANPNAKSTTLQNWNQGLIFCLIRAIRSPQHTSSWRALFLFNTIYWGVCLVHCKAFTRAHIRTT